THPKESKALIDAYASLITIPLEAPTLTDALFPDAWGHEKKLWDTVLWSKDPEYFLKPLNRRHPMNPTNTYEWLKSTLSNPAWKTYLQKLSVDYKQIHEALAAKS